ncbi:hypothetical protein SCP_0214720 [Sparassis crispa]|uniref:Uncharacterized protein n=1 Tax=Sparassis crispa TaxID=139825 RepID=A0A401GDL6_9APHY|nr:hypothetical protein SCP_0214720 [Sparassis crispa]GBE80257.1 hypothetical protein SCP_0214720 [Sparassis crispa]
MLIHTLSVYQTNLTSLDEHLPPAACISLARQPSLSLANGPLRRLPLQLPSVHLTVLKFTSPRRGYAFFTIRPLSAIMVA